MLPCLPGKAPALRLASPSKHLKNHVIILPLSWYLEYSGKIRGKTGLSPPWLLLLSPLIWMLYTLEVKGPDISLFN